VQGIRNSPQTGREDVSRGRKEEEQETGRCSCTWRRKKNAGEERIHGAGEFCG